MRRALASIALSVALGLSAPAAGAGENGTQEHVVQRVILMRHGIRSPTKAPADLARYAAEAWPSWPVPPGQLTAHGRDTLRSLGRRLGQDLREAGLPRDSCKGEVRVIADSTARNQASAAALLAGLSPRCTPVYRAFPVGRDDPLFRGVAGGGEDEGAGINAASIDAETRASLVLLQQALLGCHDDACLARAKADGKQVVIGGDAAKALKTAGSLAENIMLGYVEGMPAAQYGWGRLDADAVAHLIGLHNASFRLAHATPAASRARGGTMLAYVTATLVQAAGHVAPDAASATAGGRVLLLVGHDTDLAAQAGLLGLDWQEATRGDDYPPGGALIYDLVQTADGQAVRLTVAMPTLAALRAGDMATAGAIVRTVLAQPACGGMTRCPLGRFAAAAVRAAGNAVSPQAGDEPVVGHVRQAALRHVP
jgi:4-phytase/acid phosphatase